MRKRVLFVYLVLVFSSAIPLRAQVTWDRLVEFAATPQDKTSWDAAKRQLQNMTLAGFVNALASYEVTPSQLTKVQKGSMQKVDDGRTDQQVVGGSAAGGTGDPVAMPGLPELIAFAVSSGVASQTVNQNVVTISVNGDGAYKFFAGLNPACSGTASITADGKVSSACTPPTWANNVSVSAAFNAGSGGSQMLSGQSAIDGTMQSAQVNFNKKDFSSASLRYALMNPRSAKSPQNAKLFEQLLPKAQSSSFGSGLQNREYVLSLSHLEISPLEFQSALDSLDPVRGQFKALQSIAATDLAGCPDKTVFGVWSCVANGKLQAAAKNLARSATPSDDDVRAYLVQVMELAAALVRTKDPQFEAKLGQINEERFNFLVKNVMSESNESHDPMLTLDYTFSRPPLEADFHTFTLVFAASPNATSQNPGTLTANLGLSLYGQPQPTNTTGDTARLRNVQAAAQFDRVWKANQTPIQVSLGGYLQYQLKQGLVNIPSGSTVPGTTISIPSDAATLLSPKGLIAVAEAKVTLHVPGFSTPIPIGFTYSNRTDLLKGSEVYCSPLKLDISFR